MEQAGERFGNNIIARVFRCVSTDVTSGPALDIIRLQMREITSWDDSEDTKIFIEAAYAEIMRYCEKRQFDLTVYIIEHYELRGIFRYVVEV